GEGAPRPPPPLAPAFRSLPPLDLQAGLAFPALLPVPSSQPRARLDPASLRGLPGGHGSAFLARKSSLGQDQGRPRPSPNPLLDHFPGILPSGEAAQFESQLRPTKGGGKPSGVSEKILSPGESDVEGPSVLGFRATLPRGKPISLTYRCPCRYFEIHVAKSQIKHLKMLAFPGCPLQVIAQLKNSTKQICIDSKLKWIQEYLEKYFEKRGKM
uniref:Chemokine interleukin-8-like domain-containing protein n=1 Tax=Laticauda laticaudata TaxID=8630 RepID=A0A8C5SWS1_LATLA